MEPPNSFAADAVRTEKDKVLEAVLPLSGDDARRNVVRGQYTAGIVRGQPVKAYREEDGVAPDSMTETYVAMRLGDRQLALGRCAVLSAHRQIDDAAHDRDRDPVQAGAVRAVSRHAGRRPDARMCWRLQLQPDEGISLQFGAKKPGPEIRLGGVRMDFKYRDYFHTEPSTGYETLVYDCMIGDAMLFQRADSVEAGWAVVQPILDLWQRRQQRAARILSRRHGRPGGRRPAAVGAAAATWRPIS